MKKITHLNDEGQAHMVDISKKRSTSRKSTAFGFVKLKKETIKTIRSNKLPKGDILSIARIAGIMAAKKTSEIIPLCHPITLSSASLVGVRNAFLPITTFLSADVRLDAASCPIATLLAPPVKSYN